MRHLISLREQSAEELKSIIDLAIYLKNDRSNNITYNILSAKTLIMLFQKTSTRTRLSFEAGMTELGGHAIFLDARTTQLGLSEFKDEIRAIMRMGNILMFRALKSSDVELAASFNIIPVIDGCSEKYHPCQALGDMLTMIENLGNLESIKKIVWLGIENNVSNSLMILCAKLRVPLWIVAPERDPSSTDEELNQLSNQSSCIHRTLDLGQALAEADYVHTDTWVNMEFFENGKIRENFKEEYARRMKVFLPYQLNADIINKYSPRAKIMHCMPCHVGYEITRDAIDHPNSLIFKQAQNRKHIEKAILLWLLGYQKELIPNP